jgi:proline iminopeptidase
MVTIENGTRLGAGATMRIRDVDLFVDVIGQGPPLVLMHGGPGADHWPMRPFERLAGRFTLVFYDHRCNGRSVGVPVTSMTWENLTADADTLRERLGFETWSVLGHSFGGHVALEYVLRYPHRLSRLVLMDAGGDTWWSMVNAPELLAGRGFSPRKVRLARRFYNGQTASWEFLPSLMRLGGAYDPHTSFRSFLRQMIAERHAKPRPEPHRFAVTQLTKGWSVMDRLGEIEVPTLVIAGRDDFLFPPEHQEQLAAGIPNARLRIIERAGHNPHDERTDEVMDAIAEFLNGSSTLPVKAPRARAAQIAGRI